MLEFMGNVLIDTYVTVFKFWLRRTMGGEGHMSAHALTGHHAESLIKK